MPRLYIAVDGDDIGNRLEYLMLTNNLEELTSFSESFRQSLRWLGKCIEDDLGAEIVFSGGDNLLAITTATDVPIDKLDAIRHKFAERTGKSLSAGIGKSARQAYVALKLAKASGKNCMYVYREDDSG